MPAFGWSAVAGSAKYEFQLSADRSFSSTVETDQTLNTFATLDRVLTDGTYYWRVRSINSHDVAGPWSRASSFTKRWTSAPTPIAPDDGATITYPSSSLVLHWSAVPHAFQYLVYVATDPSLGSLAPGLGKKPVETSGTSFALPGTLASDQTYWWAVVPEDAEGRTGARSAVRSFNWHWPTATATAVNDATGSPGTDGSGRPEVLAPDLSWDLVPGAAAYEVEIDYATGSGPDFTPGSKVCCSNLTNATSLSPTRFLPNNVYHWRVRALDLDGNAGQWNVGPDFRKAFDDVAPAVPNLHLRDNSSLFGNLPVGSSVSTPLLTWDPVPGAASYEVDLGPWDSGTSDCNFVNPKKYFTGTTGWTPLASSLVKPEAAWPSVAHDSVPISPGDWCVRVVARTDKDLKGSDVVSAYTQLGGSGVPAFTWTPFSAPGPLANTQAGDYLSMTTGSLTKETPILRWKPIAGADSYYVVIAKDSSFTNVVDLARTDVPAYAPRTRTYPDETTHYYWQVLPVSGGSCPCSWNNPPGVNNPQSFDKSSDPPAPLSPTGAVAINGQPTFRWQAVEGALNYHLQVAQDPTFADPIDDITTDSTAYTSTSTYPADVTLYWRVSANDWNKIGLNWSPTQTFRRVLSTPVPSASNPTLGADIPVLRWSAVPGATSYRMHIEQGDGTTKDLDTRSTALTFTGFFGVGNLRWQVRANFPKEGSGETSGPYSALQDFTRQIPEPTGLHWTQARRHTLLQWDPSSNIGTKKYRVQISTTNSFSSTIDNHTTENTSYAPALKNNAFTKGGALYWRVATLDERGTLGAWAFRTLTPGRKVRLRVRGRLRAKRTGVATVKLTDVHGRAIRGAKVTVSGIPMRPASKRTGARGTLRFRLHPTRKGKLTFTSSKSGYQDGRATLRVR
jgi:hypothetical protein